VAGTLFRAGGPQKHGRVQTSGTADLAGRLVLSVEEGFEFRGGQVFGIVDAGGGVRGAFSGLPEGGLVARVGRTAVRITYRGRIESDGVWRTGGNDAVLYVEAGGTTVVVE
jgi:hypothetical protein